MPSPCLRQYPNRCMPFYKKPLSLGYITEHKNMAKLFTAFYLTLLFCSCGNQTPTNDANSIKTLPKDSTNYSRLQGTWLRNNKEGFTLIEIKDTFNILYYQFIDRKFDIDTITNDRYWYYKSNATMGYWNNTDNPFKAASDIWIATDKFRFDYRLKGDTLIEIDKMGDQGKLIKVENDNE